MSHKDNTTDDLRMKVIESELIVTQKLMNDALREMKKQYDADLLDHYTREDALIARIKALEDHILGESIAEAVKSIGRR